MSHPDIVSLGSSHFHPEDLYHITASDPRIAPALPSLSNASARETIPRGTSFQRIPYATTDPQARAHIRNQEIKPRNLFG